MTNVFSKEISPSISFYRQEERWHSSFVILNKCCAASTIDLSLVNGKKMLRLQELDIIESKEQLALIPEGKVLINTINAHSYNVAQRDEQFARALINCDYLMPDGAGVVMACRWLKAKSQPKERIAGWDLFAFEMQRLEGRGKRDDGRRLRVMFLGSSEKVLTLIRERAAVDYPNLEIVSYSPPYKPVFSEEDSQAMIQAINNANPDLLWIGMTAPKQEKWTFQHWNDPLPLWHHWCCVRLLRRYGAPGSAVVAGTLAGMALPSADGTTSYVATLCDRQSAVSVECDEREN